MKSLTILLASTCLTACAAGDIDLLPVQKAFATIDQLMMKDATGVVREYAHSLMRLRTGSDRKMEIDIQTHAEKGVNRQPFEKDDEYRYRMLKLECQLSAYSNSLAREKSGQELAVEVAKKVATMPAITETELQVKSRAKEAVEAISTAQSERVKSMQPTIPNPKIHDDPNSETIDI